VIAVSAGGALYSLKAKETPAWRLLLPLRNPQTLTYVFVHGKLPRVGY
jgi:hypothetical protein